MAARVHGRAGERSATFLNTAFGDAPIGGDRDPVLQRRHRRPASQPWADLLALGFTVSQVVHDYGDICQAVTELALEQNALIAIEEFHTLNRCLDNAIAEAVTEDARVTAQSRSTEELERLGQLTHEMRHMLNTALLAFRTLKRGSVGINGNTGAVLGRSLVGLHALVDSTLCDVRVAANQQRRKRLAVVSFLNDIAVAGSLDAEMRGQQFVVEPVDPEMVVDGDPQLLGSAVMNLLTNAFRYTRASGRVVLRAQREDGRLLIEVEDECGGIPESKGDPVPGVRRAARRIGQVSAWGSQLPKRPSRRTPARSTSAICQGRAASSSSTFRWRRRTCRLRLASHHNSSSRSARPCDSPARAAYGRTHGAGFLRPRCAKR